MQSFSRVVRRHEREALLQHPDAWASLRRAELAVSRSLSPRRNPVESFEDSRPVFASRRSSRVSDPFEDFRVNSAWSGTGSRSSISVVSEEAPRRTSHSVHSWRMRTSSIVDRSSSPFSAATERGVAEVPSMYHSAIDWSHAGSKILPSRSTILSSTSGLNFEHSVKPAVE